MKLTTITTAILLATVLTTPASAAGTLRIQLDGDGDFSDAKWIVRCKQRVTEIHYGQAYQLYTRVNRECIVNVRSDTHWGFGTYVIRDSDIDVSLVMKRKQ